MAASKTTTWRRLALSGAAGVLLISACATRAAFAVEVGAATPVVNGLWNGSAVEVTLKNTGKRAAKRVALSCQFFDASGAKVMTGATYFNDLGAGSTDANKMILTVPDVARGACTVR